jgi:tetratricopeptide (TPR) repeat protein
MKPGYILAMMLGAAMAVQGPARADDAQAKTDNAKAAPAAEAAKPAPQAPKMSEVEAIEHQADALWAARSPSYDDPKTDQAITLLEGACDKHPGVYGLLWRLSRAYFWKADGSPTTDIKAKWGKKGMQYGDYARASDPNKVEGQYYAAVGAGAWSQGMGILTALARGMEGKFNERLDKAIKIDQGYSCAGPLVAKGRLYYELPWPKYDAKKAVMWLDRALKVCPNSTRAYVYLADVWHKEGDGAKAADALKKCLAIDPQKVGDAPEHERDHQWCKARQAKWK